MAKTIIVPFPHPDQDPERIAATAIPVARSLAEASESRILLVSAVDVVPRFDPLARRLSSPSEGVRASLLQEASEALAEIAPDFGEIPVETRVVWGNPVDSLVDLVEEIDDPILVVGSRGRRGLNRTLYGSVALSLLQEVSCPVLVVQGLAVATDSDLLPLTKMVVPLDGSALSELALEAASTLSKPGEALFHLIHVIEVEPGLREWPVHEMPTIEHIESRQYLEDRAAPLIEQGHSVSIEVRMGRPADEIVAAAVDLGAGLIVMATHGRSGFSRLVFGSVADRVLQRSRSPLLLIRPEASASEWLQTDGEGVGSSTAERSPGPVSPPPSIWRLSAKEIMTPLAAVANETTSAAKIVSTMLELGLECVPVVGSRGELVGLVSEADFVGSDPHIPVTAYQVTQLFRRNLTQDAVGDIYAAGEEFTAGQIMSETVVAVAEDDPVTLVVRRLLKPDVSRVLVHRDSVPVGIIGERELLKLLVPSVGKLTPFR